MSSNSSNNNLLGQYTKKDDLNIQIYIWVKITFFFVFLSTVVLLIIIFLKIRKDSKRHDLKSEIYYEQGSQSGLFSSSQNNYSPEQNRSSSRLSIRMKRLSTAARRSGKSYASLQFTDENTSNHQPQKQRLRGSINQSQSLSDQKSFIILKDYEQQQNSQYFINQGDYDEDVEQ